MVSGRWVKAPGIAAAPSVSRYSKGRRGHSRRQPLRDKFLVQPVTAVVAPPNLATHKPAGNCASRNDDRMQMPGPCCCRAFAHSKGEAEGCHSALWFQSTRFMYGPYKTSWHP